MNLSSLLKLLSIVLIITTVQSISLRDSQQHNQNPIGNLMLAGVNNTDEIQKYLDGRKGGPAVIFVYSLDFELKDFSRVCVGKKINCIPVQNTKKTITDAYDAKYPSFLVIKDKWDNVIQKWTDKDIRKNTKAAIDLAIKNTSQ